MGYVGWGLVAEQANTTTGGAQRTVGITSSPGAGIAQSSLNSVNNGGGGVVNNYGAVWDNLFVRQYLFGRGEQGAWFDPSDFQPNWRRNLLTNTDGFSGATITPATGLVVVATGLPDPQGGNTARQIRNTTTTEQHRLFTNVSMTGRSVYSVQVKNVDAGFVQLSIAGVVVAAFGATFNLNAKTFTLASSGALPTATIEDLNNGFVRCILIAPASETGATNVQLYVLESDSGSVNPSTTGTNKSVIIAGAQLEVGSTATAYQPITDGIVDYLTYQPQPILYQDSAGTTPVTALEQPCGLMLDKSKGLQLGPELVTNGNFSAGTTGWATWNANAQMSVANGQMTITQPVGGNQVGVGNSVAYTTVVGRTYQVSLDVISYVGSQPPQLRIGDFNGAVNTTSLLLATGTGRRTAIFTANTTATFVNVATDSSAGNTVTFDNISVRELPGNHAYQTTSSKRPVVSARVNLLTYTEQFDNAAWTKNNATVTANTVAAPDGTLTADTVTASAGAAFHYVNRTSVPFAAASHTYRFYIKKATSQWVFFTLLDTTINYFDLDSGLFGTNPDNCTAVNVGNGWWYITITKTTTTTANGCGIGVASGNNGANFTAVGTEAVYVWGADLRPADQATGIMPRYQRVGAATSGTSTAAGVADYDSVGFPVYLRTDGIDDAMLTNSIDFSAGPTNPPLSADRLTSTWILGAGATESPTGTFNFPSSGASIRQDGVLTSGRSYIVSFTATGSGNLNVHVGDPAAGSPDTTISSTGTYRFCLVCDGVDNDFQLRSAATGGFVGTVTNLSVKEITDVNLGADKVTVFAGVRKLSDAAVGTFVELSSASGINTGTFAISAPATAATNNYQFRSRGTLDSNTIIPGYAAPITNVLTEIGEISTDTLIVRINGTQVASSATDQGTGNYGNYPLYLFARNQASNFFTGNFYGLIVRGAQTDTSLITTTEEYIANVTGFGAPVVVGTPSIGVSI